jgi:hypothetical protein
MTFIRVALVALLVGVGGCACSGDPAVHPSPSRPQTHATPEAEAAEREVGRDADLAAMRWSRRPFIIFSPTIDHDRYVTQKQMLAASMSGVIDRDVTVIEVVGDYDGYVDDQPISPESAARLRSDFNVDIDHFTVVLIGKDGGEKLRRRWPVPMHDLFLLIDSMPMRQTEMRRAE